MKVMEEERKRRAMTSEKASRVKLAGHEAEREFANFIGGQVYLGTRKKDVLDKQGNIHSVKAGENKWQIFLYSRKRFEGSIGFLGARFFIACIDSFPKNRREYVGNKEKFKLQLQKPMQDLKEFLSEPVNNHFFLHSNKLIFLQESLFHNNEVDYFTIKHGGVFHIFDAGEVMNLIDSSTTLTNSKASQANQVDYQKVLFKLIEDNSTLGEIEMRNDSDIHYRRVKFWMSKEKTLGLLIKEISSAKKISKELITYGKAMGRFKL